ncbi:putative ferric-chelate reductase 1 homolog [Galendromus occidentalis]|uniref:Ferric-chelate reductase 1 homolog n=1 Tax=Galendromus occidentalis TaxID=34638 RepID=A0AAJ6VX05_9ACAR|nr:putative ferric-chelate reductase 1 homolog [Galendromus occidentalis]
MAPTICALVLLCLFLECTVALPGGAPSFSCSSMTPVHFGFHAQPVKESPFAVRQSKLTYTPGNDSIVVALTASKNRSFKGFLVKALNPISNKPIGKFRVETGVAGRDSCHAATHVDASEKKFEVLHWSADDVQEENNFVVFQATFVETFRKFYTGVESVIRGKNARKEIESLRESTVNRRKTESGS